jgi:hypothetical protein
MMSHFGFFGLADFVAAAGAFETVAALALLNDASPLPNTSAITNPADIKYLIFKSFIRFPLLEQLGLLYSALSGAIYHMHGQPFD